MRHYWKSILITHGIILNTYEICQRYNISVDVALVYTATVIHSYEEMMAKTRKAVQEIVKKHEAHCKNSR